MVCNKLHYLTVFLFGLSRKGIRSYMFGIPIMAQGLIIIRAKSVTLLNGGDRVRRGGDEMSPIVIWDSFIYRKYKVHVVLSLYKGFTLSLPDAPHKLYSSNYPLLLFDPHAPFFPRYFIIYPQKTKNRIIQSIIVLDKFRCYVSKMI